MKLSNNYAKQHRAKCIFVYSLALLITITCAHRNNDGEVVTFVPNDGNDNGDGNGGNTPLRIAMVSAGDAHSCAITTTSALYCWGSNTNGQLGLGNTISQTSPQPVPNFNSGVTQVALGINHSCAIQNGALYCWGDNNKGQLGLNNAIAHNSPQQVADFTITDDDGMVTTTVSFNSGVTQVALGDRYSCAINSGALYCWGIGANGRLGLGDNVRRTFPHPLATPLDSDVSQIAIGTINIEQYGHSCAIKGQALHCWGGNADRQLGLGGIAINKSPRAIPDPLNENIAHVALGGSHSCAIKNGGLYCWGNNDNGRLGLGDTEQYTSPQAVPDPLNSGTTQAALGRSHSCAIKNAALYCWGNDADRQLGLGGDAVAEHTSPQALTDLNEDVTQVALGNSHSCAIKNEALYCWGNNQNGRLGLGNTVSPQLSPQLVEIKE